ncbi:hypothetical protein HPP92_027906 [Vanilla planifolia]|uniref:Uncharacterized protein n=1 Tax=Vanilla planifolia TaxID=51239 RepID=A0A835P7H4_VANPL|nr:hypothetical protein HPP92_027906 [Vanilla planifolia]KAG0448415.1 hypothetical protein HPP92_027858 [Vanilla planifolia]
MDVSGHLLLALFLVFSIVMVEMATSHGNHGVVLQEELMKLAEMECNKAMKVRGNPRHAMGLPHQGRNPLACFALELPENRA